MRSLLFIICFVCAFGVSQAQKRQNVYFLKNSGKIVEVKDSADFIRIVQEPDSGAIHFNLKEYYINDKVKTIGTVSKFEPALVYEGTLVCYNEQGKKEATVNYRAGKLVGLGYLFYPTGALKRVVDYDVNKLNDKPGVSGTGTPMEFRLDYFADSLGNVIVKDGNGHFTEKTTSKSGDRFVEEGDYLNGLKNGQWTMKNATGTYWYTEKFDNGKFISGESFKDGQTYSYRTMESFPMFKGGAEAFYKFLGRTIKYPREAEKQRIGGKVVLSFVVEKDGALSDIQILQGVYPSIDEEALRVVRLSPKWNPGTQHGVPIRVKYNIPITFSLH
ncbi:energy transducer TonB [Pedobacter metabolipauper]|uniref:TonB family protein n=1 Tax=Pedobacter metabolipauper TaxID=425513 RepID=A0A4R6SXL9_9SPHI|nr:energy transducer TonB [Pedobacter metabolipauper]TDQ09404.1 TonB family protein [Pedobacter metabolipauper]